LMAESLGLAFAPALLVAAICSLGALIPGPAVLTFEYEPTPRAFAVNEAFEGAARCIQAAQRAFDQIGVMLDPGHRRRGRAG